MTIDGQMMSLSSEVKLPRAQPLGRRNYLIMNVGGGCPVDHWGLGSIDDLNRSIKMKLPIILGQALKSRPEKKTRRRIKITSYGERGGAGHHHPKWRIADRPESEETIEYSAVHPAATGISRTPVFKSRVPKPSSRLIMGRRIELGATRGSACHEANSAGFSHRVSLIPKGPFDN